MPNMTSPHKLRILIIRHGQTGHNVKKILQGHLDTDLNENGVDQAAKLGHYLKEHNYVIDKFFTSDLKRCQQTLAEIVDAGGYEKVPVVKNSGLRERHMGVIEGMHIDAAHDYAEKNGVKSFREYGESQEEFQHRLISAFSSSVEESRNLNTIAVVTHGGSIRKLMKFLKYESDDHHKIVVYNTSLTEVMYDSVAKTFEVTSFGETKHLGDGDFFVSDSRVR